MIVAYIYIIIILFPMMTNLLPGAATGSTAKWYVAGVEGIAGLVADSLSVAFFGDSFSSAFSYDAGFGRPLSVAADRKSVV